MSSKPIVFYSSKDAKSRANAACMLASYMVLVQNWPPHLAIAPLAEADPPFAMFRDAGYSQADYTLSIQDFVYGLWRAKEANIIDIKSFDLEEYETYERVENGDFNWICPQFIAFASPVQPGYDPRASKTTGSIVTPTFGNVLDFFESRKVGLVVRLNSALYDKKEFEEVGIEHIEMQFEDGTCPELHVVKEFIGLVEEMSDMDKVVAVHCKAGLGRTGCLIGAYLIHKHSFTANEVIAYMRIMRPGMVVGPQQHWLHINQHHFVAWSFTGISRRQTKKIEMTSSHAFTTPPRAVLGDIHENTTESKVAEKGENANTLPCPTPGQPRKAPSPKGKSSRILSLSTSISTNSENIPEDEIVEKIRKSSGYGTIGLGQRVTNKVTSVMTPRRKSSRETPRSVSNGSVTAGSNGKITKATKAKGRV